MVHPAYARANLAWLSTRTTDADSEGLRAGPDGTTLDHHSEQLLEQNG